MVEIVPTVTGPGVLRLFSRQNYQGECQQETMLAIIYLWPTNDSPMHPLVLQCTLEQDRHLDFPHTEVNDEISLNTHTANLIIYCL